MNSKLRLGNDEGILLVTYRPVLRVEYLYSRSYVDVVMEMDEVGLNEGGFWIPDMVMLYTTLAVLVGLKCTTIVLFVDIVQFNDVVPLLHAS